MSSNHITTPPNPVPPSTPGKSYKELAIWSVIFAISSPILMAAVGIILGVLALMFMRVSNNFEGKGFAWTGIIIGSVSSAVFGLRTWAHGPTFDEFLGGSIMSCVPIYLIMQIWFGYAWTGRWRIAALVALIGFVPALYYSLAGLEHGSNLWPLPLILFAPVGLVYLLVCRVARAMLGAQTAR